MVCKGPDGGSAARAFGADPVDHQHLYLGTATGWIYQSHDGGKNFEPASSASTTGMTWSSKRYWSIPTDPKHIVVGAYALGEHAGWRRLREP